MRADDELAFLAEFLEGLVELGVLVVGDAEGTGEGAGLDGLIVPAFDQAYDSTGKPLWH